MTCYEQLERKVGTDLKQVLVWPQQTKTDKRNNEAYELGVRDNESLLWRHFGLGIRILGKKLSSLVASWGLFCSHLEHRLSILTRKGN